MVKQAPYRINGTVSRYPGVGGWYFVRVPDEMRAMIHASKKKIGYGFVPIVATVGKTSWNTSLLPGKGMYFIALKAEVRKKENIADGDRVSVTFTFV